jgi:N-glycosylase/DNA lyase
MNSGGFLHETFPAPDYDLAQTLNSGQAFRWQSNGEAWEGVVANRWVRLREARGTIVAEVAEPVADWSWLRHYLQVEVPLSQVLAAFPDDPVMRTAARACRGLRLLRQDPWECLASFVLSSTKQIVQIKQIIELLCRCYGERVPAGSDAGPVFGFPGPERIASLGEGELRACKMGFRAPYLAAIAQAVTRGEFDLGELYSLPLSDARERLMTLKGVGRKIADCVLLFAYGFPKAFPVDTWVLRALKQLYFPGVRVKPARLREFSETYFGPFAGYAQQYLFHYVRVRMRHPETPMPQT